MDFIISLALTTHVAWSNSHKLYHMDEISFSTFREFESELEIRYLICKRTLASDI